MLVCIILVSGANRESLHARPPCGFVHLSLALHFRIAADVRPRQLSKERRNALSMLLQTLRLSVCFCPLRHLPQPLYSLKLYIVPSLSHTYSNISSLCIKRRVTMLFAPTNNSPSPVVHSRHYRPYPPFFFFNPRTF